MRITTLMFCLVAFVACDYFPSDHFPINDEGHWELIESDNGYEPTETWTFENGLLLSSETIEWCRCAEQGRRIQDHVYDDNEIRVSARVEGSYSPGEFETRYVFDEEERVTLVERASAESSNVQTFEYDEEGFLVEARYNDELTQRAERNSSGDIVRLLGENNIVYSEANYDSEGRMSTLNSSDSTSRFQYDDQGRLEFVRTARAPDPTYTSRYVYNDDSTLARLEVTQGQNQFRSQREFSCDDQGRLTRAEFLQENDSFPFVDTYAYDDEGRLSRVQYFQFGEIFRDHQIEYRALGNGSVEILTSDNLDDDAFVSRELWQRFDEAQRAPPNLLPRLNHSRPSDGVLPQPARLFR